MHRIGAAPGPVRTGGASPYTNGVLLAFTVSFGVAFVAELGDKSQLMALTFATRYRTLPVLVGITLATAVVHAVSVAIGYGLGAAVPTAGSPSWRPSRSSASGPGRCAATR
jgi:Uncharacterized protein family UPF0016